jgi:hypothetical protein
MDQIKTVCPQLACMNLLSLCREWHEVGSRVTCDPLVMDTDRDVLCLVSDWRSFLGDAVRDGFEVAGSVPLDELEQRKEQTLFTSLKRGEDNLIVTDDEGFAKRFMVATRLAKRFNLRLKEDRIALFQGVLYANG